MLYQKKGFFGLLFLSALISSAISYANTATTHVTDLYEVGQQNVALTSSTVGADIQINHQYIYTPYGIQKDINVSSIPKNTGTYQQLRNQIRRPLSIQHNQFGYTGQTRDVSTGLMMLGGFRHYAPGIARFIQPDTYNSFSDIEINNKFSYVNSNPLLGTDPTGHFDWSSFGQSLGAMSAGIVASLAVGGVIFPAAEALGFGSTSFVTLAVDGALSSAAGSMTSSLVDGRGPQSGGVATSFVTGGITSAMGAGLLRTSLGARWASETQVAQHQIGIVAGGLGGALYSGVNQGIEMLVGARAHFSFYTLGMNAGVGAIMGGVMTPKLLDDPESIQSNNLNPVLTAKFLPEETEMDNLPSSSSSEEENNDMKNQEGELRRNLNEMKICVANHPLDKSITKSYLDNTQALGENLIAQAISKTADNSFERRRFFEFLKNRQDEFDSVRNQYEADEWLQRVESGVNRIADERML